VAKRKYTFFKCSKGNEIFYYGYDEEDANTTFDRYKEKFRNLGLYKEGEDGTWITIKVDM
jgi:hypothetical protein